MTIRGLPLPNVELETALILLQSKLERDGTAFDIDALEASLTEDRCGILLLHPSGDSWVGATFTLAERVEFPQAFRAEQFVRLALQSGALSKALH